MSNLLDSDVQEDVRTFPMYQRLRKTNPYAYYSLNTQKQMQSDLRNYGSLTFFEQDPDNIPDPDEPKHSIDLPKALAEAEHMLDRGSAEFNEKTETILSLLYATDTVPIRRCSLHCDTHKVFAALIVMMHEQSLQLEVNEYNTNDLRVFGYCVSEGVVGTLNNGHH